MSHMAAETERLPGLHVVQIRYQGSERALPESDPVDAYAASGAYQLLGEATIVEPEFPEEQRDEEPTINLGLIGGEIAEAVAAGRRAGKPVLVVGGNCAAVPGVVGGLQQAHGPAAKTRSRLVRCPRRFQHSPHDPLRHARRHAGRGLGRSGLPPLA